MDTLTVIVVSYNTQQMTLDCLKSIYAQTKKIKFNVIVVDNNSRDDSAKLIAKEFPHVQLISLSENIGFSKANNLAATNIKNKYILLLNPDTVVLNNAIEKLVDFAEQHPNSGIWGGKTLNADYSLNPTSCWGKMSVWSLLCRALFLSSLFPKSELFNPESYGNWQRNTVREIDIVTGCFLLIKSNLWHQLKGFDNDFFMYGEEADLCLRAKKLGYQPLFTPEAEIVHYDGASEKIKEDRALNNKEEAIFDEIKKNIDSVDKFIEKRLKI